MTGPVFDEPTARRLARTALEWDRAADLLNTLEAGGAVTVDGTTGELVCIPADALLDMLGTDDDEDDDLPPGYRWEEQVVEIRRRYPDEVLQRTTVEHAVPVELLPWPPPATHYHGFWRAVIVYVRYDDDSGGFPVGMVDGMQNNHAPRGLWDQRKDEWYSWWTGDDGRASHSCRPVGWHALLAIGEVIDLAVRGGYELPPWVVPS